MIQYKTEGGHHARQIFDQIVESYLIHCKKRTNVL